jgi:recombinational DNA repair protein RecT
VISAVLKLAKHNLTADTSLGLAYLLSLPKVKTTTKQTTKQNAKT